jgi:hypothetical protein
MNWKTRGAIRLLRQLPGNGCDLLSGSMSRRGASGNTIRYGALARPRGSRAPPIDIGAGVGRWWRANISTTRIYDHRRTRRKTA